MNTFNVIFTENDIELHSTDDNGDRDFAEIVIQGTIAETGEDTQEQTEYTATVTIIGR
ncbi:hypothetical protein HT105_24095 [Bacteroides fragilis]|nr:hypothetical protein [Bacteroides fragilis]